MIVFKVCRDCGEEYRPEILRCADCGGELVARYAEGTDEAGEPVAPAAKARPPAAPEALDPAELRPLHVADRAADLEPFARALGEAAIPFLVRANAYQFALLVRESDLSHAAELLRPILGTPEPAAEPAGAGPAPCPACGQALDESAAECPACGLVLAGPAGRPCAGCGKPVAADAQQCRSCGAAVE